MEIISTGIHNLYYSLHQYSCYFLTKYILYSEVFKNSLRLTRPPQLFTALRFNINYSNSSSSQLLIVAKYFTRAHYLLALITTISN